MKLRSHLLSSPPPVCTQQKLHQNDTKPTTRTHVQPTETEDLLLTASSEPLLSIRPRPKSTNAPSDAPERVESPQ
eukprot:CAMPEP_0205950122 /NCGR_PEP_ID=MMETSP1459-20131121/2089_1 /ASSEMBLY_ACC=CAM_ASM_001120 /TAXON_ID=41880 /ORGANISM="Pycnococcus provasolii, Strain RCC931" /LENGTH=74 /DNA_ID=CAMNT_0053321749 /DNA_START=31 /DNA_END=252 /DNA_ORIENTATION=+